MSSLLSQVLDGILTPIYFLAYIAMSVRSSGLIETNQCLLNLKDYNFERSE